MYNFKFLLSLDSPFFLCQLAAVFFWESIILKSSYLKALWKLCLLFLISFFLWKVDHRFYNSWPLATLILLKQVYILIDLQNHNATSRTMILYPLILRRYKTKKAQNTKTNKQKNTFYLYLNNSKKVFINLTVPVYLLNIVTTTTKKHFFVFDLGSVRTWPLVLFDGEEKQLVTIMHIIYLQTLQDCY